MPYCMKCFNEKEKKNHDVLKLVFTDEPSICEKCGQRKRTVVRVKDSKNMFLVIVIIINLILWPTAIYLFRNVSSKNVISPIAQPIASISEEKIDYQKLIQSNTKTLNAGEYLFEDKFKDPTFYKVKPINIQSSGNFTVYDENDNLITNEILGSDYGIGECITILDKGYKIKISGIDRVKFSPVIMGSREPEYEDADLIPGYHLVGHTVSAGRYTAIPSKGSGNFAVYRGNSLQANEILGGDIGVSSYRIDLEYNDLIYTSGVYVKLKVE